MRILRLLMAGLVAIAAMVMVVLAAAVVFFTGLVAFVLQLLNIKSGPARSRGPATAIRQQPTMQTGDVIDVVTTNIPTDSNGG